ncbi:MAG: glutamine synthetase type III, partial [Gemmatimonadota bacterium]
AGRAKDIGVDGAGVMETIHTLSALIDELRQRLDELVAQNAELGGDEIPSKARHMRDNIVPAMAAVRDIVDRLEKVVPDDLWPLPTYRDMLFVK